MPDPHLKQLIEAKRKWDDPLTPEDIAKGFKGWYSSKYLPHFDSPGAQQYITYRLADSLPAERRQEWEALLKIEDDLERQRKLEAYLDLGHGACYLRDPRIADLVQGNLWHHDGSKYRLLAWVVMPNHVHALIEVWGVPLGKIIQNWKTYTAKAANETLRRNGSFWEEDYFDRYIRDEEHFRRVVRYIENNPVKAHLVNAKEEWRWSSARYRSQADLSARTLTHPGANRVPPPP
ncbi:MAG TPA: transposase [Candidatus Acidoferrum sp.]|jgi:REP element-mobilizing transposase RayT|nr:transposase [Candidatus Acidoferrum sp.]